MSIVKSEVENEISSREAEINDLREKYGSINRRALENLGYTHETITDFHDDMDALIESHCPITDCPNKGKQHCHILSGRGALMWGCMNGCEYYLLLIKRLPEV